MQPIGTATQKFTITCALHTIIAKKCNKNKNNKTEATISNIFNSQINAATVQIQEFSKE